MLCEGAGAAGLADDYPGVDDGADEGEGELQEIGAVDAAHAAGHGVEGDEGEYGEDSDEFVGRGGVEVESGGAGGDSAAEELDGICGEVVEGVGESLVPGKEDLDHWKTTTLIAALGIEGVRCSAVVDRPVNREVFEAFVEQALAPSLRSGDVVAMDNLSRHKIVCPYV
ncbi:MAG: hypothetical protein EA376_01950 [Phycisphaeraceae bacterium]|nr:MAG: hypothetical protein EA376_01950 [Phycisphaeraceae bacterium]